MNGWSARAINGSAITTGSTNGSTGRIYSPALADAASSPRAENTADSREREKHGAAEPQQPGIARRVSSGVKELFGKLAEAVTGKPTPSLTARRKRRDETGRAFTITAQRLVSDVQRQFRKIASQLQKPVARLSSILDNLYAPLPYDPAQERAVRAERFLRLQIEELTHDDQEQDGTAFSYARAANFDPQP